MEKQVSTPKQRAATFLRRNAYGKTLSKLDGDTAFELYGFDKRNIYDEGSESLKTFVSISTEW